MKRSIRLPFYVTLGKWELIPYFERSYSATDQRTGWTFSFLCFTLSFYRSPKITNYE
jgi:hypothetical protein